MKFKDLITGQSFLLVDHVDETGKQLNDSYTKIAYPFNAVSKSTNMYREIPDDAEVVPLPTPPQPIPNINITMDAELDQAELDLAIEEGSHWSDNTYHLNKIIELETLITELESENNRLTQRILYFRQTYNYTRGELQEIAQKLNMARSEAINHIITYFHRKMKRGEL